MKPVEARPYADPETAARKLVEIAAATPAVQDGRIYIEGINSQFVAGSKGNPEFGAGIAFAKERGWLEVHESGTYVRLLQPTETL